MGTGRAGGGRTPHRSAHTNAGVLGGAVARPVFVPVPLWPGALLGKLRDRLRADAAAEAASGRLILWLPVLLGIGILLYFGAAQEPSLIAAVGLSFGLAIAAVVARARPVMFAMTLAALALALGFTIACAHTTWISHPIILPPPGPVRLIGHVEQVERRPKADRILLRVSAVEGRGLTQVPALARISLGRGYAPPAGTAVSVLARLLPPMEPALPGGHDFGRGPWFRGIDAVGFGLGRPKLTAISTPPPLSVRMGVIIEQVRQGVGQRIRQSLSGTQADIAVALVVGDRAAISPVVEESMRVSGLTHVLSISGLHMAMVAGTLFALVRGLLALCPPLALGFPIKTAAALTALAGSAVYLVLSGNDWPAQRSFYMLAIVLAGVMAGRSALTLRTVAVAAVVVLALGPEALLEAGTQMSFAATLALVAAYERWSGFRGRPTAGGPLPWQIVTKGALFVAALSLTSVVAGAATAPYAALHFQRVGAFGLLSNLAAMPAVEFLVMPFGLAGVLLMPFGWDFLVWPVMGWGIEIMVRVSDLVAALPGADTRTDLVGPTAACAATLALLCLCLLRGSLMAIAIVPAVAAVLLLGAPPRPDVLVAPNAQTVAVRAADGRLSVIGAKSNRLVVEQWLSREGDARKADAKDIAAAFTCDAAVCVAPVLGGGRVAVARKPEHLEQSCAQADILITPGPAPATCTAKVVSTGQLARTGTLALFREPGQAAQARLMSRDETAISTSASQHTSVPQTLTIERHEDQDASISVAAPSDPFRPDTSSSVIPETATASVTGRAKRPRMRKMAWENRTSLQRHTAMERTRLSSAPGPDSGAGSAQGGDLATRIERSGDSKTQAGLGIQASNPTSIIASNAADGSNATERPRMNTIHANNSGTKPENIPNGSHPGGLGRPGTTQNIRPQPPQAPAPAVVSWREVPTRRPGVQRPWMPVLPPMPELSEPPESALERAADDAAGDP